jgi:hypothetical protein
MDEFVIECVKRYKEYFRITGMNLGIELKIWTVETDSQIKEIKKVISGDITEAEKVEIEKLLLKERIKMMQGKYPVCETE